MAHGLAAVSPVLVLLVRRPSSLLQYQDSWELDLLSVQMSRLLVFLQHPEFPVGSKKLSYWTCSKERSCLRPFAEDFAALDWWARRVMLIPQEMLGEKESPAVTLAHRRPW